MDLLLAPFSFGFMRNGFLAAALIGTACAVLGCFVVLRRMAFIGDALAHTALPGLALSWLNGWSLFLGALASGLVTAFAIGYVSRRGEVREDTAIGVLFTTMFALGILLMSGARSFRDLSHMLFGNILGVGIEDLLVLGVVCLLVVGVVGLLFKELALTSVDPTYAEGIGLRADYMRYLLLFLLTLTVISGIQAVGVVLTSALLITPAAAAALLTDRLPFMMAWATVIAVSSSIIGLYLSYYLPTPSGAAIVIACSLWFMLALAIRTLRQRMTSVHAK